MRASAKKSRGSSPGRCTSPRTRSRQNLKEVFFRRKKKSLEEKSLTKKSISVDLVGAQIEPVYLKIQGHLETAKHFCQNLKLSQNII
jgi:hypothetical protein